MRHRLAVRVAVLETVGNRLELVGRLPGQHLAGAAGTERLGIVENIAQAGEIDRVGELFQLERIAGGRLVGPAGLDAKEVGVAGDMQRRVFQGGGVTGELFERLAQVVLLLLVLPGEKALLPDVRPALAAAGLGRPLLEREMVAGGVVLGRGRVADEAAEVEEMLLRRRPLGQRHRLPFADEVLRGHRTSGRAGSKRAGSRRLA